MKRRLVKKLFKKGLIKYGDKRLKKIYRYISKIRKYMARDDYNSLVKIRYGVRLYNDNIIIPSNAIA